MEKYLIDKIWQEELKRFGLENEKISWRHGYPKADGLLVSNSYVDVFPGKTRVTIDETLKSEFSVRKDIRHELYHAFCLKYHLDYKSELDARFAEFFPNLSLRYCRMVLKARANRTGS